MRQVSPGGHRRSAKQKLGAPGQGSTVGCCALVGMRSASKARRERGRERGTRANKSTHLKDAWSSKPTKGETEENKPPRPRSTLRTWHSYDGIDINQIYVFGLVFSLS